MVLDEPFLFSVSIRDNIAYGRPDASLDEVAAAARAAGADDFIRALPEGYDTVVGERGYTLSGGQRQRHRDRPHAGGQPADPRARRRDLGHRRADRAADPRRARASLMQGRTTLIIAHRLSTISLADRVAVLEDGRVIAEGTHAELLATEPALRRDPRPEEDAATRAEAADARSVEADDARLLDATASRSTSQCDADVQLGEPTTIERSATSTPRTPQRASD